MSKNFDAYYFLKELFEKMDNNEDVMDFIGREIKKHKKNNNE